MAGLVLAWLALRLLTRVEDVPSSVILQFVSTFGVWILAERMGLSGVLTMVCYATAVARRAPDLIPARRRIPSYAVWDTAVFVLNVLAFVLIGLQVRPILRSLDNPAHNLYLYAAGATLLATIAVRFAWVMAHNALSRWWSGRPSSQPSRSSSAPTVRGSVIVAWCGMRGIVTLAAALALPTGSGGDAFPHRDFIVLTAFCVVLGTLVLQGLTLRPLLHALALPDDDLVGREVGRARERALQGALASLEGDASAEAEAVRRECAPLLGQVAPGGGGGDVRERPPTPSHDRRAQGRVRDARERRDRRRGLPPGRGGARLGGDEPNAPVTPEHG